MAVMKSSFARCFGKRSATHPAGPVRQSPRTIPMVELNASAVRGEFVM
jgi:hypothetical protein